MTEVVTIDGDYLVVRMSRETLAHAARLCPALEFFDEKRNRFLKVSVVDADNWMKSVAHALTRELGEDGTTLVHRMFDAAFLYAVEQGLDGIEIEAAA